MASNSGSTGTPDVTYDIISVVYHSLQGAETYDKYIRDAESEGRQDVSQFFRDVKERNKQTADQGKQLLGRLLNQ